MELSWTGESKELCSGNSWAVNCEEGEQGEQGSKMVIEVDVTKFRVQPFRSYKVCIRLEDSHTKSHLNEVCTHLFSFEKYVPYVPEEEVEQIKTKETLSKENEESDLYNEANDTDALEDISIDIPDDVNIYRSDKVFPDGEKNNVTNFDNIQKDHDISKTINSVGDMESVIKHQLGDIDNYVRDDFKSEFLELKHEIIEELDQKFIQSASNSLKFHMGILVLLLSNLLLNLVLVLSMDI